MALVIVLSVFNGFENSIVKLFNTVNADIKISPSTGKTISTIDFPIDKIKNIKEIKVFSKIIEENALVSYNNQSLIAVIKGVDENYTKINQFDTCISEGHFLLKKDSQYYAIVGQGVSYYLNINFNDVFKTLTIHIPRRTSNFSDNPTDVFNVEQILPIGSFRTGHEIDANHVLLPYEFVANILEYENEFTSLEISVEKNKIDIVKNQLKSLLGEKYDVKDRFEQEASLYKILKSEKFFTFLILLFILIIAAFNIISSLSMLILDKKKDIGILKSMGANQTLIKIIFFVEGMLISGIGTIIGILLGLLLCFLQMKFAFIVISSQETGNIMPYPIDVKIIDLIVIIFTVTVISAIASWYATQKISPLIKK